MYSPLLLHPTFVNLWNSVIVERQQSFEMEEQQSFEMITSKVAAKETYDGNTVA